MDTIIARSMGRMWTAFRTTAGIPVLNIEDTIDGERQTITILMNEDDARVLAGVRACCGRVDDLLRNGARISPALRTPPLRSTCASA